ncbi:MAG: ribosome biogenesis GTP-binding protein YihA/YsxC [Cyclobacteriaceae bacterium]|jgi:GTP-binding protein|nr:ribosome biogenesis GTP-binding protein YihA/YsxC [Cyclobacteriaceae bacterium]
MIIRSATFISSVTRLTAMPSTGLPEMAFIGRSNVGKSSLINMLTGRKQLAKTSAAPGKTQTVNHFLINDAWYLVDLPGYGYASVSKTTRSGFGKMIEEYVLKSKNLHCLFVLIDLRLKPQAIDSDFISWAGRNGIPMALVYTKADKLSNNVVKHNLQTIEKELLKTWQELPPSFITSAEKKTGRDELLSFIDSILQAQE